MRQRLIDANNLYADYIVASTTTNMLCYRYISKEQVENAPTVEAIPVEWILHYVDTHYNVDNFDGIWRYIMKMHDEWEKENEK